MHDGVEFVADLEALAGLLGEPHDSVIRKVQPRLEEHARAWIAASPFCLLATSDGEGNADLSPRGDPAGFVKVLDDGTIVVPERPGNKRHDTLRNIIMHPSVGLLFLIPGREETLRVNGRARVVARAPFMADLAVDGKAPKAAILVEIDEVFFHCAKAFRRSGLWRQEGWPEADVVPSLGAMMRDILAIPAPAQVIDADLEAGYRATLY
ncbi:pyridoxamine 5'-phosphate oxidase family protein [Actinocorallia sp. A-T 12471]|uniref:pyridoxamine 5'-phosphate oxidase family protein n=1 Tax=Actinocorallia sp. A-T 12471 TaxID=3089813 RepID=UPI0029CE2E45|nr:pyridoxamine 5'-phosphate oxidase family protein [Actinocorallia sp. A-T 12471]MDX6739233.1 pyridoxamine 5'-phosphate oxidase family protein [Actinocorallia sp. A-T 12471]